MESGADTLVDVIDRRGAFIERLEQPVRRSDLNHEMELSRPTVYRALDELHAQHLVVNRGETYAVTDYGRLVYQAYEHFVNSMVAIRQLRDSVCTVPDVGLFDPVALIDADIHAATEQGADAPLKRLQTLLEGATRVRIATPVVPWHLRQVLATQLATGLSLDLVVEAGETGVEELPPNQDRYTVLRRADIPAFLVALVDSPDPTLGLVLFDDVGRPEATICNATTEAIGWGEAVWQASMEP